MDYKDYRWKFGYVTCLECGDLLKTITKAHCKKHGMTLADYKELHGIPDRIKILNHKNLKQVWKPDIEEMYEGDAKFYLPWGYYIHFRSPVKVRFCRDYVSGNEIWAGHILRNFDDNLLGYLSSYQYYNMYNELCYVVKIEDGRRHAIKITGIDNVNNAYNFIGAWPWMVDNSLKRHIKPNLDKRVEAMQEGNGENYLFKIQIKPFAECKNETEELINLTRNNNFNSHDRMIYRDVKDLISRAEPLTIAKIICLTDWLSEIRDFDALAIHNMLRLLRPDALSLFESIGLPRPKICKYVEYDSDDDIPF